MSAPRPTFVFSMPRRGLWLRHARMQGHLMPDVWRGMFWVAMSGVVFTFLNTLVRAIALTIDPFQVQLLRYFFSVVIMLPLLLRQGWRSYWPVNVSGQLWRGAVHTLGLAFWFTALPRIGLADTTAISFTGPIFIMMGASWFLGETMRADRWVAALVGFAGVLVVIAPKLTGEGGWYPLIMLASSPILAASFLMSKSLTRYESPGVIVFWQSLSVTVLSVPMGLAHWTAPSALQWLGFAMAGLLGALGYYLLNRGFRATDISATQSLRFLDLVWAALMGWLVFADVPSHTTMLGALVILASTVWIAHREHRREALPATLP